MIGREKLSFFDAGAKARRAEREFDGFPHLGGARRAPGGLRPVVVVDPRPTA
jgi:hypothetical protein